MQIVVVLEQGPDLYIVLHLQTTVAMVAKVLQVTHPWWEQKR